MSYILYKITYSKYKITYSKHKIKYMIYHTPICQLLVDTGWRLWGNFQLWSSLRVSYFFSKYLTSYY